ncbi:MAG: hypothetical protein JW751_31895 [Polyangiaceae bacterium]|nr:hypothetical protein [Polyangiaceae bacterium]
MSRATPPNPLAPEQLKSLGLRLGLPVLGLWVVGGLLTGMRLGPTVTSVALVIPGVITAFLIGLVVWAVWQTRKARGVHGILSEVKSADDRKAAIEKLETTFKKKDVTAVLARAQLLMQEDPRKALSVMEEIDLGKVMPTIADEVRAQRALVHLMLGEASLARPLADGVDLSRHQDAKTRAMLAGVVAEAWARTGQCKKSLDTLALFSADDPEFAEVRPQLLRAIAFASAHGNDPKAMRRALKKLAEIDIRMLGGFLVKKAHPLLQKEARRTLEQSGQVPRKMQVVRH